MNWKSSGVLALIALLSSSALADSFFGIEIGQPFVLRDCIREDLEMGKNVMQGLCTRRKDATRHPWGAVTYTISTPFGMTTPPWGWKAYGFSVTEWDGKVVQISVATFGYDWQDAAARDLSARFGTPSSVKKVPLQNMFGARITGIRATWKKQGYEVVFAGVNGEMDSGLITISASEAKAEHQAADSWRKNSGAAAKM